MIERIGPLVKGSELLKTADPKKCKFHAHLIFFYELDPAYSWPVCLHPKVCQSDSPDRPFFRTEEIGCNPDNCPFIQKIEIGAFPEITLENLAQEEITQLPHDAGFHLAYDPTWTSPPRDFKEKSIWGLFSSKEGERIEELSEKIDGLDSLSAKVQLMDIVRKIAEAKSR